MTNPFHHINKSFVFSMLALGCFVSLHIFVEFIFNIFNESHGIVIGVIIFAMGVFSAIGLVHNIKGLKEPYTTKLSKFVLSFCFNAIFLALFVFMIIMNTIEL